METKDRPKELAIKILREFYVRYDRGPGFSYYKANFMCQGWENDDLETGLIFSEKKGWLMGTENDQFVLTEEGFRVGQQALF